MITGLDHHSEFLLVTYIVEVSPWKAVEYTAVATQWFYSMMDCQLGGMLQEFDPTWGDVYGYVVICNEVDLTAEMLELLKSETP